MYKEIDKCLCCSNSNLELVLDLNTQPLANSYLKNKDDSEKFFPLSINYCRDCTHIQLTHAVDPDLLFKDYLYVSGTTKTGKEYFDWFVNFTKKYTNGTKVLDIACNDGTQLDSYKKYGYETFGIDPARNLFELSSKNHNVVCDYLSKESLEKFDTKFDVIIAQNVFAHNTYPKEFLNMCQSHLSENGFLFIQTSQADMIQNNQFDTIYHEHISFFSVKSFCTLAKNVGLNVIDAIRTPIHGTSFVFVLSKNGTDNSQSLISKENELTKEKVDIFAKKCKEIAKNIFTKIEEMKVDGYKVIGYGAAAKGMTFLNFSKIKLDYILDDNSLKQNLYTPGSKIPIYPSLYLMGEKHKTCIVPLAWNFLDEIRENVLSMKNADVIFLTYYPKVELVS